MILADLPLLAPTLAGWMSGIDALERDIIHFVTCRLHADWLHPILMNAQEKVVAIPLAVAALGVMAFWRPRVVARATLTCLLGFGLAMLLASALWNALEKPRPPKAYATHLRTADEIAECADRPDALVLYRSPSRSPAFPSRHGLTAGVLATAFWLAWRPLGIAAAFYALLVCVGRIYIGRHWPSDVLAGVVIGGLLAILSWRILPGIRRRLFRGTALAADPVGPPVSSGDDENERGETRP